MVFGTIARVSAGGEAVLGGDLIGGMWEGESNTIQRGDIPIWDINEEALDQHRRRKALNGANLSPIPASSTLGEFILLRAPFPTLPSFPFPQQTELIISQQQIVQRRYLDLHSTAKAAFQPKTKTP
jgi:hypothetical protein